MRHVPIVFASVVLCVAVATPQPQFEPVPDAWLEGAKLVATDLNVSLVAPGLDWDWLISSAPSAEGPNGFQVLACRSPDGTKMFLVAVHNPYWGPLDADSAEQLTAGVRQGLEDNGITVIESTHERSRVPLSNADRFAIRATLPDGGDVYSYGYSATRGRLFQFQYAGVEASEPIEFRSFVESFELVGDVPERFPEEMVKRGGMLASGLLVFLTLLVGLCGFVVNAIGGRVVVNVWTSWLGFLGLYVVALSVLWWAYAPADLEPYAWGYVHGSMVMGPAVFPALFAFWRRRRVENERAMVSRRG